MTDKYDEILADARAEAEAMTDGELARMSQGCSELTCIYHGIVNQERRRRAASPPESHTQPI